MTDAQWARLRAVFSAGVCDYGKPGIGETGLGGTWAFFTAPGSWTFHEPRS